LTRSIAALALALSAARLAAAGLPDPGPFDAVLAARARDGGFDYRGTTGQDRKRLAAYLANLGDADVEALSGGERVAFFINAYNALAIETLLDNPGRRIVDIDGAFQTRKHRVGGRMRTLDEIENELRRARDARIHFAIVCASRSCPPLAARAYRAEGLSEALDRQARLFLNDPARNVFDRGKGRVALSMIFQWNREEFERGGGTLPGYVAKFVSDRPTASWLSSFPGEPEFLEYDWSPNQP